MKIETVVEIDKPPSEVYDFLMDEENLILWIKNFVRLERLEGDPGEIGSTSKHYYDENGRQVEFIEKITKNERNKLLESELNNKFAEMTINNKLEKTKKNFTKLTVTSEITPKNLFYRFIFFFTQKKMINRQREDIDRLKNAIEKLSNIE